MKSGLNDFISKDVDGLQMMNLLDPDIPLEYLIPPDLPYAESYEQGISNLSGLIWGLIRSMNRFKDPCRKKYDSRL